MRIRSTKPEFWRSETISRLDWSTRLVLKGIESYVDDNGVGKDSPVLFAADVFPHDLARDSRDTLARVEDGFLQLAAAGILIRYEAAGEHLIYVDRWKTWQRIDRPNKGRFPRPDGTLEFSEDVDRESYTNTREDSLPGTGEQGNRGTGEQKSPSPPPSSESSPTPAESKEIELRGVEEDRPDVERVCGHLAQRMLDNGTRKPAITKSWRDEARRLLDNDKIPESDIHAVIDWCQNDSFWKSNILSVPKLRKKFDTLKLQMHNRGGRADGTVRGAQAARAVMNVDVRALADQFAESDRQIENERPF
ncbi:helix-turn-helix DNA-binding domain protein [Gordonia phage SpeedDemon]|uniref:Uncharacterized protein n=1 Tax=Gordonia phage Bantam TaxID=1887641 RepID=A0A1B3AYF4_9CAUD|nr:replication initiation protein [Gordonia phage Bantam]AOE43777.1 hypothetical protein SEA_BANTAM_88 [Gordonia phage Bantam]QNL30539.1 helix-turn-helix DNA-binding domain protein [Gordonia phage SpeedDemon]